MKNKNAKPLDQCLELVGKNMTFDYGLAMQYEVTAALALSYFAYYTVYLQRENKHYYKERYWVPASVAKLEQQYPFLGHSRLRTALLQLEEQGVLFVDNFNKQPGDKTKWYALNQELPLIKAYLETVTQRFKAKNKYQNNSHNNTTNNNYSLGENSQALSENQQDLGENVQAPGENPQAFGENHQAISNTNNTSNIYNNNSPNPSLKRVEKKRRNGSIVYFC